VRDQEVHGRLGDLQVLDRGGPALDVVGLQQRRIGTEVSFQAAFSASPTPELSPRAPNGETMCAQSPASSTRPTRIRDARRAWKR
jgi:hypothetical protein